MENKAKIITVAGKGGVGKTSICACIVRLLVEKYPDRKVLVVDSCTASSGYGMLMDMLYREKQKGKSLEECYQWALDNRIHAVTWFFSSDLTWFVRGGRVKPMAGFIGNILNICPVLYILKDGSLAVHTKVRGRNKAMQYVTKRIETLGFGGSGYSGPVYIAHSDCLEEAEKLAAMIKEAFPNAEEPVISYIGTVIGSHTGPGSIVLSFWGADRIEQK